MRKLNKRAAVRMCAAVFLRGIIVFGIWICFCAIADHCLYLEANSWRMLFGYGGGAVACAIGDKVADRIG